LAQPPRGKRAIIKAIFAIFARVKLVSIGATLFHLIV
jgi:hypothetical protein